jgi:hypothetical protein
MLPLNAVPGAVSAAFSGELGWSVTVNVVDEPNVTLEAVSEAGEAEFDPCSVIDWPLMETGAAMFGVPDAMIT